MRGPRPRRKAFSLVELLVVIAIIAVLISMILPAVQKAREAASRTRCANNMKQLGLACLNYESANTMLPPAGKNYGFGGTSYAPQSSPIMNLNGLVLLLPYLEQQGLYQQYDPTTCSAWCYQGAYSSPPSNYLGGAYSLPSGSTGGNPSAQNVAFAQNQVKAFQCPSEQRSMIMGDSGTGYYGINGSANTSIKTNYDFITNYQGGESANVWSYLRSQFGTATGNTIYIYGENSTTKMTDISDGTSNTLGLGEISYTTVGGYGYGIPWAYRCWVGAGIDPGSKAINLWATGVVGVAEYYEPSSYHVGGCNFAAADGAVHFISQTVSTAVMAQACTYHGAEVAGTSWPW